MAGHGGENRGFLTDWVFSRTEDLCIAVMINQDADAADERMIHLAVELYNKAKGDGDDEEE